jgi:hypothetical protein
VRVISSFSRSLSNTRKMCQIFMKMFSKKLFFFLFSSKQMKFKSDQLIVQPERTNKDKEKFGKEVNSHWPVKAKVNEHFYPYLCP